MKERNKNGTFAKGHKGYNKGISKIVKEDLAILLDKDDGSFGCLTRIATALNVDTNTVLKACKIYGLRAPYYRLTEEEKQLSYNQRIRDTKGLSPQQLRRLKDPRVDLLRMSRIRSRQRGLDFNLELSDIVIPEVCPVLGIPIYINIGNRGFCNNSPTLDRIDNNGGYTWDNVIVVSGRANKLKNDSTVEELGRIVNFYSNLQIPNQRNPIISARKRGDKKLSTSQETALIKEYGDGTKIKKTELVKKYGISYTTVCHILSGRIKITRKKKSPK